MKIKIFFLTTIFAISFAARAADSPATVRAVLQQSKDRKPAPGFVLKDASGKTVKLSKYRGKVVLLDFWATWCHGCKKEIPWFAEFQKTYGPKGFTVVGVALDDDGWKAVTPYLASSNVPYPVLLGDAAIAKQYGAADMLPDSFLLDRKGRIAATYNGLVDKDNVEANLRSLLGK
jgi:peroxiredoxin